MKLIWDTVQILKATSYKNNISIYIHDAENVLVHKKKIALLLFIHLNIDNILMSYDDWGH